MQTDLFAPPPMAALAIQPNAHGVYPDDQAEILTIDLGKRDYAKIRLLHIEGGWMESTSYGFADRGGGGPLMARNLHPDRKSALDKAIAQLRRHTDIRDDHADSQVVRRQAAQVREWLATVS